MLRECHQIPWAGDKGQGLSVEPQSQHEDDDEPKSKSILLERIAQKHQQDNGSAVGHVFVGPTTYINFIHCFRHIFKEKQKEAKERVEKLT